MGTTEEKCVFCQIVSQTRSAEVVYSDQHVLGFLDHFKQPAVGAHVLIITRAHNSAIWEVPDEIGPPLVRAARIIATALKRDGHGVKCWASNGTAAGQAVRHFHLHILTLDRPLDLVRYYIRVEILRHRPTAARLKSLGDAVRTRITGSASGDTVR